MSGDKSVVGGDAYSAKKKNTQPVFRRRKGRRKAQDDKKVVKQTAAELRVQSDLADLDLPNNVKLKIQAKAWKEFVVSISPLDCEWQGATYRFRFKIPAKYPFDGPKVQCLDKIYHPNIDLEGKVCVNVLRPWKPTYSIQIIIFGLLFLFSHPNPNDPLNKAAAQVLRDSQAKSINGKINTTFRETVKKSLAGKTINGVSFPKNPNPNY